MTVVVLDTNILISALLSPHSKPYRCVDLARTRNIKSVTCKEILEELKSKLSGKLKYLALDSEAVVQEIISFSEVVNITNTLQGVFADPKDNMVIECAVVGGATHIITGDKRHLLPLINYQGIAIISASDFLKLGDNY